MDKAALRERPILGLSGVEAGEILGVTALTVSQMVAHGVLRKRVRYQHNGLDRADVEAVSLERWKPGRPYWVNESEAAQILAVSRAWVGRLFFARRYTWNTSTNCAIPTGCPTSSTRAGTTTGATSSR